MPSFHMTDRGVAGLKPIDGRPVTYFDTKAPGLALRANRNGSRTWFYVYRHKGSASQWLKLGVYDGLTFGLAAARKAAKAAAKVRDVDGQDPKAVQLEQRAVAAPAPTVKAFTFADFVPVFVGFQKGRTSEWADEAAKIERYLLPAWKDRPLRSIIRPDIHELLNTVAGKGLTTGVNRLQAVISRMFTVALDRSLVDAHPCARMIKRFTETPRDRVLSDDELRGLIAGLEAQRQAGNVDAADAMELRVLLGQRGAETVNMKWSELALEDEVAATWSILRTRTKKRKGVHVVPLPAAGRALAILTRRRAVVPDAEARVFPGLSCESHEQRQLAGIHGDGEDAYEWKDLRRTVGTRLAELGFSEETRGRILNHAKHSVTEAHYNVHAYDAEKRTALAAWDAELTRILEKKPKRSRVLEWRDGRR